VWGDRKLGLKKVEDPRPSQKSFGEGKIHDLISSHLKKGAEHHSRLSEHKSSADRGTPRPPGKNAAHAEQMRKNVARDQGTLRSQRRNEAVESIDLQKMMSAMFKTAD
jgi:hypothetical protein